MRIHYKLPIIIKKIQSSKILSLEFHEVKSNKLQTPKHIVKEVYIRTTFFPKKT
jgi:hypothetical protein